MSYASLAVSDLASDMPSPTISTAVRRSVTLDLEGDRGVLGLDWHSERSELWRSTDSTTEAVRAELERRELKRRERLRRTLRRDMRPLFRPGGDEPLASLSAVLNASLVVELLRALELLRPLFHPVSGEPLASVSAVLRSLAELCRRSLGVELFRRIRKVAMRFRKLSKSRYKFDKFQGHRYTTGRSNSFFKFGMQVGAKNIKLASAPGIYNLCTNSLNSVQSNANLWPAVRRTFSAPPEFLLR